MTKTKTLTLDQIRSAEDRKIKEYPVPDWGGVLRLRPMSGGQREAIMNEVLRRVQRHAGDVDAITEGLSARLIAMTIVDEDGAPLLTEEAAQELVDTKRGDVIAALVAECQAVNGMDFDGEAVGKAFSAILNANGGSVSRES